MTALSELLLARMPADWKPARVAQEISSLTDERLQIDRSTVYDYLNGKHATNPRENVLAAFAAVLPVTVTELREAAGVPIGEDEPWTPPDESARLDKRQRRALEDFIKAFTSPATGRVLQMPGSGKSADVTDETIAADKPGDDAPPEGRERRERGRK